LTETNELLHIDQKPPGTRRKGDQDKSKENVA
jgi:hypothetical protein